MGEKQKPIVYSCSGCSNLAQMAHELALNMDLDGIAEMSCVSGVIGKVKPIMRMAQSGRPIIAIDGCSLKCTKACLDASGLNVSMHFDLSEYGFEKRSKEENIFSEGCIAMNRVYEELWKAGYTIKSDDKSY